MEYNPAESTFLAGATGFLRTPAPFVGFDVTTIGPFEVIPLAIAKATLGLSLDYGLARLLGLACCIGTLNLLFLTGRKLTGVSWAPRATVLGGVLIESLITTGDLVNYASEMMPMLVLFLMVWLGCEADESSLSEVQRAGLIGFLGSSMAYLKLQGAPLAAFVGIAYLLFLKKRRHRYCRRLTLSAPSTRLYTFDVFFLNATELRAICWSCLIACLTLAIVAARSKRRAFFLHPPLLVGLGFLVLAIGVIALPGNGYTHYLRFAMAPAGLVLTLLMAIGGKEEAKKFLHLALLLLLAGSFGYERFFVKEATRLRVLPELLFQADTDFLIPKDPIVIDVLRFAKVGEPVAVWGWVPRVYCVGHLGLGTRDTICERIVEDRFDQAYYRRTIPSGLS